MGRKGLSFCTYDPRRIPGIIYGVRIANVDKTNHKEAIKRLEDQNKTLHLGLAI